MARRKAADILFWVVAALGAALFVAFALALAGVIPVGAPAEPAATEEAAPAAEPEPAPATQPPPARTTSARPAPPTTPTQTTTAQTTTAQTTTAEPPPATTAPSPPATPRRTTVSITATRGDSWFQARAGSEEGRILDERLLAQGQSAQIEAERIWLSVGAAGNVDITVNGKPRTISPGTISVVLTSSATTAADS